MSAEPETGDPLAAFDPAARAALHGRRRPPHPGRARHALRGRGRGRRAAARSSSGRGRTSRSRCGRRSAPASGDDAPSRLATLEREAPELLGVLQQVVVFGYYTDKGVRDLLGYPGQEAKTLYSWKVPDFIEEGLTDRVLARGPVWRDPETGRRAEAR